MNLRFSVGDDVRSRPVPRAPRSPAFSPAPRSSRAGVALVVTLILLAVITTMAIAFVALTHRETAAVAATGSTTDAELAAEAGLERAKAEIIAQFTRENLPTTNNNGRMVVGPEMMVSLTIDEDRLKAHGAYIDPSPPVYINTNQAGQNGPLDDRHYLDLNRNRYFDETGWVPITGNTMGGDGRYQRAFAESEGAKATNFVVGDPKWIGVLANPLRWHTNNNQYISRFAYLVLPAGRSLDLNAIHNQAINLDMRAGFNGFYRNQGVGSWEINLAGFLSDLNTNEWPGINYGYNPFSAVDNGIATGPAFDDAREILRYRYTPTTFPMSANPPFSPHTYLDSASSNFPPVDAFGYLNPAARLGDDNIDEYADSRLLRSTTNFLAELDDTYQDNPNNPWPGARNKRNFHSIHDLWDPAKLPNANGLRRRLADASAQGNSYDRYTYYRLLSQLGTDSSTEDEDKINLNFVNVRSWLNSGFRLQASDLVSWTNTTQNFKDSMGRSGPELFFLSVARKLFMQDPALRGLVTNGTSLPATPLRIPVMTNGSRFVRQVVNGVIETNQLYSARIHQILQQAANLYDSIRGVAPGEVRPYYPTVFRPMFKTEGNNVYVINYELMTRPPADVMFNAARPWRDLEMNERPTGTDDFVYDVPMILGARQGFPNFNEFASQTILQAVRRLTLFKPAGVTNDLSRCTLTEELSFNVQNRYAFEMWYSYYTNLYNRPLGLYFSNSLVVSLRSNNAVIATRIVGTNYFPAAYPNLTANSMVPSTRLPAPTFSERLFGWTNSGPADRGGFTNALGITVRNQLRYFLVDNPAGPNPRLVDAVTITATNDFLDIGSYLSAEVPTQRPSSLRTLWSRNTSRYPWHLGADSQIAISRDPSQTTEDIWKNYGQFETGRGMPGSKDGAILNFNFLLRTNTAQVIPVPFAALRYIVQDNNWRTADPLVHYTSEDLWRGCQTYDRKDTNTVQFAIGTPNIEMKPWPRGDGSADKEPSLRDPGVKSSDLWRFPTNRLPSIGWIGRIHRGTPWQSIYLKSQQPAVREFAEIIGGRPRQNLDNATNSTIRRSASVVRSLMPDADARLLDIFTTTIHPNATRGRMSINQTNLASWSAVFSGVDLRLARSVINEDGQAIWVPTNYVAEPAGLDTNLLPVFSAIIEAHQNRNREFSRLSELIAIPQLSTLSPYLTAERFAAAQPVGNDFLTDADYERIPEQLFGLLKVGEPRFVIYSWGQSLKPAEFGLDARANGVFPRGVSVETSGDLRGLVRNYQITGEQATRAVVRIGFDRLSDDPNSPLYDEFNYSRPHAVVESFNILPPE